MELNSYIKLFSIMFPIALGITAIFSFYIGLRGILTKKPFMISNRWFLATILFVFIPLPVILVPLLSASGSGSDIHFMKWLIAILCGLVLFVILMVWYSLRGYVTFGVTDMSFQAALLAALEKLQLPYEESLSAIRLTSIEADLQVVVQSWTGTALIKVKQRTHRSALREIVNTINEYFRTSSVSTNLIPCIVFLIMGIFEVLFAIAMFFFFNHLITLPGW
ncbi:hypothetical protein C6503_10550 [Candidatus Poribacteria bacterium]|nr:MAG: hypothetical protein C6503_10550 [Candidatus Poribacteria bacterium]